MVLNLQTAYTGSRAVPAWTVSDLPPVRLKSTKSGTLLRHNNFNYNLNYKKYQRECLIDIIVNHCYRRISKLRG